MRHSRTHKQLPNIKGFYVLTPQQTFNHKLLKQQPPPLLYIQLQKTQPRRDRCSRRREITSRRQRERGRPSWVETSPRGGSRLSDALRVRRRTEAWGKSWPALHLHSNTRMIPIKRTCRIIVSTTKRLSLQETAERKLQRKIQNQKQGGQIGTVMQRKPRIPKFPRPHFLQGNQKVERRKRRARKTSQKRPLSNHERGAQRREPPRRRGRM